MDALALQETKLTDGIFLVDALRRDGYDRRFGFEAEPDKPLLLFLLTQAEGAGSSKSGPA